MPSSESGQLSSLQTFDANIGPLAAKYNVTPTERAIIHQCTLAWGWWIDATGVAAAWAQSMTAGKAQMHASAVGVLTDLPGGPVLPPVPVPVEGGSVV